MNPKDLERCKEVLRLLKEGRVIIGRGIYEVYDFGRGKKEITEAITTALQLIDEYEDICETHKIILEDKGAHDEIHCTCVPALRQEIKRLEAETQDLKDLLLTRDHCIKTQKEKLATYEDCIMKDIIDENVRLKAQLADDKDGCVQSCQEIALLKAKIAELESLVYQHKGGEDDGYEGKTSPITWKEAYEEERMYDKRCQEMMAEACKKIKAHPDWEYGENAYPSPHERAIVAGCGQAVKDLKAELARFNALTEDGVEKEIYGWLEDVDDAHMNSENELSHFDIAMKIKNDLAKSIMRYVRGKE